MAKRSAAPVLRSGTSRGSHVHALAEALCALLELIPEDQPSERRVRIRDHLMALIRAYPELQLTTSDVAQLVAEEDGDAIEESI